MSTAEDRKVTFVVNAFRQGKDTMDIAESMHMKEHIVERMLHVGLAAAQKMERKDDSGNPRHR